MSEFKLLSCPFCGFDAPFICTSRYGDMQELHYHVHCGKCGSLGGHHVEKDKAIEAWNTRKPMENIMEQLMEEELSTTIKANMYNDEYFNGRADGVGKAIKIIEEENAHKK
ncbi:MAG: Lar family restriction alleviation protein [Lachnospiraceae bacterium]|nr:Lar family restriction alleviation protein [Lachnospiraceae bacterium]